MLENLLSSKVFVFLDCELSSYLIYIVSDCSHSGISANCGIDSSSQVIRESFRFALLFRFLSQCPVWPFAWYAGENTPQHSLTLRRNCSVSSQAFATVAEDRVLAALAVFNSSIYCLSCLISSFTAARPSIADLLFVCSSSSCELKRYYLSDAIAAPGIVSDLRIRPFWPPSSWIFLILVFSFQPWRNGQHHRADPCFSSISMT